MNQKSNTAVFYPILSALSLAAKHVEQKTPWQPTNEQQKELCKLYSTMENEACSINYIQSKVSHVVEELNTWMKEKGFDIQLDSFEKPSDFGVVSILDVMVEWKEPGLKSSIMKNGKEVFEAVKVDDYNSNVYRSNNHPNPIAVIATKSGERVCMTIAEDVLEGFELVSKCMSLNTRGFETELNEYSGVLFPMVSLNQQVDIKWLKDLWCVGNQTPEGNIAKVKQALQQTKFRMNHLGARAESAVALGMMRCASARKPKMPLKIDKPFLLWIERDGLSMPLFTSYITEEDWKNPGDLK